MIHRNYYGQPYPQGTFDDPKTRMSEEDDPICYECGNLTAKNDVRLDEDIVVYYCDDCYTKLMNQ